MSIDPHTERVKLTNKQTNKTALNYQKQQQHKGKGPKIKKRESMVFDHQGGGGHPKPNP